MAKKYELTEDISDLEALAREVQGLAGGSKKSEATAKVQTTVVAKAGVNPLTKGIILGAGMGVVLMGAGFFIIPSIGQAFAVKNQVPNVIGLNYKDAKSTVTQKGFRVRVQPQQTNARPRGTVVSIQPAPGTRIPADKEVTIVYAEPVKSSRAASGANHAVTKNPHANPAPVETNGAATRIKSSTIPEVEGMIEAKARTLLEKRGLKVTVITKEDRSEPDHIVLASDPKAGAAFEPGATIRLIVNALPAPAITLPVPAPVTNADLITIKDYAGRDAHAAISDLTNLGFTTTYTYEASRVVSPGSVVKTIPPTGSQLPYGSEVKVVVAE